MQSIKKIGLLGGSFDPIHNGHLQLAKAILKDGCEEVWFIPCVASPLKNHCLSDFDVRVDMIQAAIKPFKKMKVCTIEKKLPIPSYTYNTLTLLTKQNPQVQFVFYIGNDQAKQLDQWYQIEKCFQLCEFKVFKRDEAEVECCYDLKTMELPLIDISSTNVRNGRMQDVPKSVRHLIWEKGLYLDSMVKHAVKPWRYEHSLSVAALSKDIAKANHLDEEMAYRAGLLHDYCKDMPHEASKAWMRLKEAKHIQEPEAIWHGYLVDHLLKRKFVIHDSNILKAVHHHVEGKSHNPYAQIVFIADKCDPLRAYDASETIALAKRNLKKAKEVVRLDQIAYLKKGKV